jgi:hypothetical protein
MGDARRSVRLLALVGLTAPIAHEEPPWRPPPVDASAPVVVEKPVLSADVKPPTAVPPYSAAPARVYVKVLGPDGLPMRGAWLLWWTADSTSSGSVTLPDGTADLGLIPPGDLHLSAGHDRTLLAEKDVTITDGDEERTLTVRLASGAAIEGIVLDLGGKPVEGAVVATAEKAATTGEDGRFRIEGLALGSHRLGVSDPRYWWNRVDAVAGDGSVTLRAIRTR